MVVQKVLHKGYEPKKAFEPFSNFVSNEEPSPDDTIFMGLIERHFLTQSGPKDLTEG